MISIFVANLKIHCPCSSHLRLLPFNLYVANKLLNNNCLECNKSINKQMLRFRCWMENQKSVFDCLKVLLLQGKEQPKLLAYRQEVAAVVNCGSFLSPLMRKQTEPCL